MKKCLAQIVYKKVYSMVLLFFLQLDIWRAYEIQVCFFKWNYAFFKFKEIFELEFYNFYRIIDKKNMNKRILL